ncbi:tRNA adenosine(34) deaminase TadA [Actinobaculum massiliense]|uniref:tRNA adenosine(34) deaminase TadA n=1 Tax=Actinobaculum massiliense TaxID=202789 RepID=UPI0003141617|nr:tRNA adenosine(34) deaminase TadA [Actinobaculum massiliense]MDK8318656.1 tRNA adenosine(34) deaminase TadA [Actinobaculum massiliense]MDK8566255.1 tRNA adenosine(34) deaminase TadA [Actinobaculum massiliense]
MREREEGYIRRALAEAEAAAAAGDVPVGALVVVGGRVVAAAHNTREVDCDPTAHAEILALRRSGRELGRWRLDDADLYVTLEPCTMCAGAIVAARIRRLVFAAWDPKAGAAGSLRDVVRDPRLNHRVEVIGGVLEGEARAQLAEFFSDRRAPDNVL